MKGRTRGTIAIHNTSGNMYTIKQPCALGFFKSRRGLHVLQYNIGVVIGVYRL